MCLLTKDNCLNNISTSKDDFFIVYLTNESYIGKVSSQNPISLNRTDYFLKAILTKEEHIAIVTSLGRILYVDLTSLSLQENDAVGKDKHISEFFRLNDSERVLDILNSEELEGATIFSVTKQGRFTLQLINDIQTIEKTIETTIKDPVVSVGTLLHTEDKLAWFTKQGRALVMNLDEIKPKYESSIGIKGLNLEKEDEVLTVFPVNNLIQTYFFFVTENGYGAKVPFTILKEQKRGGKGKKFINITEKNGLPICVKKVVDENVNYIYVTSQGRIGYFTRGQRKILEVPIIEHISQGVKVVRSYGSEKLIFVSDADLFRLGELNYRPAKLPFRKKK